VAWHSVRESGQPRDLQCSAVVQCSAAHARGARPRCTAHASSVFSLQSPPSGREIAALNVQTNEGQTMSLAPPVFSSQALFRRDRGSPLYRCPEAVWKVITEP